MEKDKIIKAIAVSYVSRPNNIVEIFDNEDWNEVDTLDIVKNDTLILKKIIDGQTNKGILIILGNRHLNKEIIQYYQDVELGEIARAMLIKSFAGRIMGNLYLKLFGGKPNEAGRIVPAKLFTRKEEAEDWLIDKIQEHKK